MKERTASVIAHGMVAALVAHLVVALVLVVGDLGSGRAALYTPALLGAALLDGVQDTCEARVAATNLLAYAAVHFAALLGLGVLASQLIQKSEERPALWFGAWLVFFFVAWHLGGAVVVLLGPVQGCLSLAWIFSASIAGAAGMAIYLWQAHPRLRLLLRTDRYA